MHRGTRPYRNKESGTPLEFCEGSGISTVRCWFGGLVLGVGSASLEGGSECSVASVVVGEKPASNPFSKQ